jgi:hypothetical protein
MVNPNPNQSFIFYSDKLNFKSVDTVKGKEYFVEGYISTGDMDLVNDIVTKNCMDSMENQFDGRSIKLDFEHETFRGKGALDTEANKTRLPLGKAIGKSRDDKGVNIKWQMNPTWKKFDEKGNVVMTFKDIWTNIESGMYDAFSIAYLPTRITNINREGKSIRLLDNVNLLNVALTGNPINPAATMTAVMAKSLEFMKDQEGDDINMNAVEIKNIKEKKSYKDDGKHVHTTEVPMGEHNHPEIESEISRLWERIYELNDDMYKATNNEEPLIKSKNTQLSGKNADKENMGCKPMEEEVAPEAKAQAPVSPVEPGQKPIVKGAEETEPEAKSMTLMELKSIVETLTKDVDELKKENADLKAIVEKPMQKSKGAENKEIKGNVASEMIGPLDMI